jgi:hypothetical protein
MKHQTQAGTLLDIIGESGPDHMLCDCITARNGQFRTDVLKKDIVGYLKKNAQPNQITPTTNNTHHEDSNTSKKEIVQEEINLEGSDFPPSETRGAVLSDRIAMPKQDAQCVGASDNSKPV